MKINTPKVAILVDNMYQTLDVWYPYLRLRESGIEPVLIGIEKKGYLSNEHYPAAADLSIKNVIAKEFVAVIIPGGYAPYLLSRDQEIIKFIREIYNQNKIVAAICHGIWALISSNILKNRSVVDCFTIRNDMINAGANFINREVVIDGKLITSSKTKNLPSFCQKLIGLLEN